MIQEQSKSQNFQESRKKTIKNDDKKIKVEKTLPSKLSKTSSNIEPVSESINHAEVSNSQKAENVPKPNDQPPNYSDVAKIPPQPQTVRSCDLLVESLRTIYKKYEEVPEERIPLTL